MKPFTVLLVDDEADLILTLAERLTLRGIPATVATDGDQALQIMAQKDFDIALLDAKMPGISGSELLKRINVEHPDMKVILVTGRGSREEYDQAIEEGAFDYLVKPVDLDTLIATMRRAMDPEGQTQE